jgi:FAD/FMN-containing dehydrogenase
MADAPADLALSTRGLDRVVSVSPADLVATVEAGTPMESLRRRLADEGMWLAIDPPGRPERSLGSVVATGTAGPLRHGFGPVRDHVLGCTVATGDGRLVRAGGRVVKNVAGYDLTKLQVGGFGGFGIIVEVHLRLRALPRADVTLIARGPRDTLTSAARDLIAAELLPGALELLSPALAGEPDWTLAARFAGTDAAVQGAVRRLSSQGDLAWQPLPADRTAAFWGLVARGSLGGPMTLRLGVLGDGVDETIDLLAHDLDEGLVSAGAGAGMIRWTGDAPVDRLRAVRRAAASREIPMTLERAPWPVRRALGHFGAYREGVGQLVDRLRDSFDPGHSLSVALEGVE